MLLSICSIFLYQMSLSCICMILYLFITCIECHLDAFDCTQYQLNISYSMILDTCYLGCYNWYQSKSILYPAMRHHQQFSSSSHVCVPSLTLLSYCSVIEPDQLTDCIHDDKDQGRASTRTCNTKGNPNSSSNISRLSMRVLRIVRHRQCSRCDMVNGLKLHGRSCGTRNFQEFLLEGSEYSRWFV